ncbi:hypothetical protein IHN63_03190 [Deinococcus sp. 6YEL10]|uniref:hypothetical protein n=1 Tax=Deinococcus sp. 6YEL10 TaxID=2745870 RepID=UPI001E3D06D1|nr:hypothetical protein [Deinococcus sp. 6YEL10]MCD0160305.1 hypothetical protein [Deinococcus sp. 6YEL10]
MTRPPTALEVLDLLAVRARYREWLASGHLEADHGMIADNLTRVTAQVEALKHQQITEAMSTLRDQAETNEVMGMQLFILTEWNQQSRFDSAACYGARRTAAAWPVATPDLRAFILSYLRAEVAQLKAIDARLPFGEWAPLHRAATQSRVRLDAALAQAAGTEGLPATGAQS